ncbi:MAG: alpha/beta hydrolase [Saprospiraceae bacterium]|nr:alpha/beta hydrolase [Saprospiraceae bacterium]
MEKTTTITAKDGIELFTRSWTPPQYKAIVALVHGFGEHSGRFQHVAAFLNKNGYAVVALDLRGHGKSGDKRGHSPSNETTYDDIELFIRHAKTIGGETLPLFLYGHSMGGNFILNTILRRNTEGVHGLVTTGPLISLAFKPKPLMLFLGKTLRSIAPRFSQPGGVQTQYLSHDPAVVQAYINDPLVHGTITTAAGMNLLESSDYLNTYEGTMPVPTLMMHGTEDFLTYQPASEAFASRVKGNITYRKWEGLYHEIHNEPEKIQVLEEIVAWLDTYI